MELRIDHLFELLEGRLNNLRRLHGAVCEGQKALVKLNLDAIRDQNCEQQSLCTQIRRLDAEIAQLKQKWFAHYPAEAQSDGLRAIVAKVAPGSSGRLEQLLRDHDTTQAELQRVNRIQAELLRRSRRSIQMLSNLLAAYVGTYQPPGQMASRALYAEGGF